MRFRLVLDVNRCAFGDRLPINYQYEQSAAIYRILSSADASYAEWLHDNGFRLESGKTFKLFTYSRFKIDEYRILRDEEDIQLAKSRVDFTEANEVLKEKRIEKLPNQNRDRFLDLVANADLINRSFDMMNSLRKTSLDKEQYKICQSLFINFNSFLERTYMDCWAFKVDNNL